MRTWISILGVVLVLGSSCGKKNSMSQDKLPALEEQRMVDVLDSISKTGPDFFSARLDTKYSSKTSNLAFKTSLKIHKDNAVHTLISFAGIPIITAMVTNDSVKASNKKDKCYILEDLEFFKTQFGVEFSLQNLEEILLGRPLQFDKNRQYHLVQDPYNYILSSQSKNKDQGEILFNYHLSKDLKYLRRVEIVSFKDEVNINVTYNEYFTDSLYSSPKNVSVEVKTQKDKIALQFIYDKIEFNNPKEMVIIIPESYARCN